MTRPRSQLSDPALIEDPIAGAHHKVGPQAVGQAEPGTEVILIRRKQLSRGRPPPGREALTASPENFGPEQRNSSRWESM